MLVHAAPSVILRGMPTSACIPLLKALADETRWRIVSELLSAPRNVGELVERLGVSQYNVSKHVRILREAGIVETERDGKHVHCRVAEDFRKQMARNRTGLDLGCCTFRFDAPRRRGPVHPDVAGDAGRARPSRRAAGA